jgi:hypothetical protein
MMMADTIAVLPPGHEATVLAEGEDAGPDELTGILRNLQEKIDPVGTQERDEAEAARRLERDWPRRGITVSELEGSRLVKFGGYLDAGAAAVFLAVLAAMSAPQNSSLLPVTQPTDGPLDSDSPSVDAQPADAQPADAPSVDAPSVDAPSVGPDGAATASATGSPAATSSATRKPRMVQRDERTLPQRRHDALVEMGHRLQAMGDLPDHGGDRPQMVVTMSLQTLRDGLYGLGRLDDGTALTPAECRQYACDAHLIPAVLGSRSEPLDLGRASRTFNAAIRRALKLRDGGCAFPGCDRPASWCEGHHCIPWYRGGPSDLTNACLACRKHHRLLHHSGWTVRINPHDGRPDFFAPGDPTPRRNYYHRP